MKSNVSARRWFSERPVVIATRHRKEVVIAPLLEKELGVRPFVMEDFDTDQFGTFSGEVERSHDPVTTLRMKCAAALDASGSDLAVASEGSFGPHPMLWMLPADEEWVMLSDRRNNLEVIVRELTTETNYGSATVSSKEQLEKFATKGMFPSHGLIIRQYSGTTARMVKGITDRSQLIGAYSELADEEGRVKVETDMRALYNPSRMSVIKKVTEKLVGRIKTLCPGCSCPGFGITGTIPGRPCSQCKSPTSSVMAYEHSCGRCGYCQKIPAVKHLWEDPMYCDVCNP